MADLTAEKKDGTYLKQLYFVLFLVMGLIGPFSTIFFKKILLTVDGVPDTSKIRILTTVIPGFSFLSLLVVGYVSDKFRLGRHLLSILCWAAVIPTLFVALCGHEVVLSQSLTFRFVLLALFFLIYKLLTGPVNQLLDSETLNHLDTFGERSQFGTFRIWGTLGWAFITILIGTLLTYLPWWESSERYSMNFYFAAFVFLFAGFIAWKTRGGSNVKPIKIPWKSMFRDKPFFVLLLFAFIGGVVDSGASNQYMGYYLDDVMKTPLQIGLIYGFWTTFEIPVMHYSHWLLKNLGSRNLMYAGMVFTFLKLFLFASFTVETPYVYKFLAALIHGPAFACYYLAIIDMVDSTAPKEMKATYLGVMVIVRQTLAGILGGWLGGTVIKTYGGSANAGSILMLMGAFVTLAQILVFTLFVQTDCRKD